MVGTLDDLERGSGAEVKVQIVDVDVHPVPRSEEEIYERLPEPWRSHQARRRVLNVRTSLLFYPTPTRRGDAIPPGGGPIGSDPALLEQHVLGDAGVDYAILLPLAIEPTANPAHEAAVATSANQWQVDTWLSKYNPHGRYRGSIAIGGGDPVQAAREIERWAGHPYLAQVVMPTFALAPFGQPRYYPIYEAAARHGLPVVMHVATRSVGMGVMTPVGYVSYAWEYHALYAVLAAAHFVSLLCEGVFERFPTLKFVFLEGGFGWVAPLLWRLDQRWRALRAEVPALERRPSEYAREHIRFSTQPVEEPADRHHFVRALELGYGDELLMFATDYPHWDGDYLPRQALRGLPERTLRRVLCENALELYRLPPTRPANSSA